MDFVSIGDTKVWTYQLVNLLNQLNFTPEFLLVSLADVSGELKLSALIVDSEIHKCIDFRNKRLHGPSMFAVKAKIYGVLYKQSSSVAFDETSSYS